MESKKYSINQRRLRMSAAVRELAAGFTLHERQFIQPLFIGQGATEATPIDTLNESFTDSETSIITRIEADMASGINKFLLFPVLKFKQKVPNDFEFICKVVRAIKKRFADSAWIAADLCLCAYTTHGHCGILNAEETEVLNDPSVTTLAKYATALAQAGVDCVAPSDMMDGRVAAIRQALNNSGHDKVVIMSYSAKFSSQFYGPFRDACSSSPSNTPHLKNRKTYQASPFNPNDVIKSTYRDINEGADIVMVKPAVTYMDIISRLHQDGLDVPLAAYHVSGEYQSIELLAQNNLIERAQAHIEVWASLKRAGADIIISYAARHAREWINKIEY